MITKSKQQTINLGKKIANTLKPGDIVLLEGELGAGKTTLVKGIAQYFGIKKNITSPTFALMNVHPVKSAKGRAHLPKGQIEQFNRVNQLVHIDTYRLEDEDDLIEIGVEDYLGAPDTVCLIEWPEKIKKLLKNKKTIRIMIEHLDKNKRITEIKDKR